MSEILVNGTCLIWHCKNDAHINDRICADHAPEFTDDWNNHGYKQLSGRQQNMIGRHLLRDVFDLDDGTEIVDEIAVDVAIIGQRKVKLTKTERLLAIRHLIDADATMREMADQIGTDIPNVRRILKELDI